MRQGSWGKAVELPKCRGSVSWLEVMGNESMRWKEVMKGRYEGEGMKGRYKGKV